MKRTFHRLFIGSIMLGAVYTGTYPVPAVPGSVKHKRFRDLDIASKARFKKIKKTITDMGLSEQQVLDLVKPEVERSLALLSVKDTTGNTLLSYAAEHGRYDVTKFFVEEGADPKTSNDAAESIVVLAIRGGNERLVDYLLDALSPPEPERKAQPVIPAVRKFQDLSLAEQQAFIATSKAVTYGKLDRVRQNLEAHKDFVRTVDARGNPLLHTAVKAQKLDIVKLLIQKGADVNQPDDSMITPLSKAISTKNRQIIQLLMAHGGILYATCVVMLLPDYAYRLWQIEESFRRPKYRYLSDDVRDNLDLINADNIHFTLLYLAVPVSYNENESAYRALVKEALLKIVEIVRSKDMRRRIILEHRRDPFIWDKIKWLGSFLVVSYKPPKGYQAIIDDFLSTAVREIPGIRKKYVGEEPPHISVGKIERGSGLTPATVLKQSERVAQEKEMFDPQRTFATEMIVSARSTSQYAPGYIEVQEKIE